MPRLSLLIAIMVAFIAVLGAPGAAAPNTAAKPAPGLPDAPLKCPESCYGRDFGPQYMDNTYLGELTVGPHIVQLGQSISVTAIGNSAYGGQPKNIDSCGDREHCSFKPTAAGGWVRLNGYFCNTAACGIEQDAYYVLGDDEYAISGNVTDAEGHGVKGARIDISPGFYAVTENTDGLYQALLKKGTYTVTGPAGYCVKGVSPCTRSKVVNLTSAAAVDFTEDASCEILSGTAAEPAKCHRVFGTVLDEAGKPANGVAITLSSGRKKLVRKSGQDGPGAFSFKVKDGTYTITAKGRYCILPWKEDPKKCSASGGVTLKGADKPVNFTVEAYTVSVYTWGADHAVPRAGVRLRFTFVGGSKSYEATTDGKGKRSIRLPRGSWNVRSLTDEYCYAADRGELKSCDRAYVLSLIKPSPLEYRAELYKLAGTVASKNGKPQAKVDVRITGKSNGFDHLVRTAADGTYAALVRPGNYAVAAKHPKGYVVCAVVNGKANPCKPEATVGVEGPVAQDFEAKLNTALKVKLEALSDDGWNTLAGKSFDANRRSYKVGFQSIGGPSGTDARFGWDCHTGCVNVMATITDAETGKAPSDDTLVRASVGFAGEVPYSDAETGVICTDGGNLKLTCGGDLVVTLKAGKSQVPLYYFTPGVASDGIASLQVTADTGKESDDLGAAEHDVKVRKHGLYGGRPLEFRFTTIEQANAVLFLSSYWRTGEFVAPATEWCSVVLESLSKAAAWGAKHRSLPGIESIFKRLEQACGLGGTFVEKFDRLKYLVTYGLWGTLMEGFQLPPAGLRGVPTQANSLAAFVLGGGSVQDALFDGVAGVLAAQGGEPTLGDALYLRLTEVSHRLASGKVENGLLIDLWGKRGGNETPHTITYASDGYLPECWLDPSLNQDYSLVNNPCHTPHP